MKQLQRTMSRLMMVDAPLAIGTVLTAAILAAAAASAYAGPTATASAQAPSLAPAVGTQTSEAGAKALAALLKRQQPATRIDSVQPSPVPGLYEVVMGRNVAYVEPGGRFAIFGNVWDLQEGRDLTASRKSALDKIDVDTLPTQLALRSVHGTGQRVLHVFADPMCGYCRQLEQSLAKLDNATIYTHLLPVLGEPSKALAADIWCSPERAQAWSEWMVSGRKPSAASPACAAQFAETSVTVQRIASNAGIQATPTLIAQDGRRNAGAMPLQQLESWLAVGQAAAGAPAAQGAASVSYKTVRP